MQRLAQQEPVLKKALAIEKTFMLNEKERYLYDLIEKALHDRANRLNINDF
jgi:hypothetical protein